MKKPPFSSIVGVGSVVERSGLAPRTLAFQALSEAAEDAGLTRRDIDGLLINFGSFDVDCDQLPQLLGLDCRYVGQTWPHGRLCPTVISWAAGAVNFELANYVACLFAVNNATVRSLGGDEYSEAFREGGGPHLEAPEYGVVGPIAAAALAFDAYMGIYGGDREDLGWVAMTQRYHASLNQRLAPRELVTLDDYRVSPPVVSPLRVLDCAAVMDAAFCVIVARPEAGDAAKRVAIRGMQGMAAGREEFVFGRRGLGIATQALVREPPPRHSLVFRQAGITHDDVDFVQIFDAFSPLVPFALEEFDFCKPGEGLSFIKDGRIHLGGKLPVNTSGGSLAEGSSGGWGHVVEAVRQLRGGEGARQVKDARVGLIIGTGASAVVLTRE